MFLTSMKYYVWGESPLTHKEKKMLRLAGVLKPKRSQGFYGEDGQLTEESKAELHGKLSA